MFAILPIAVLLASASVSALVIPRRAPPPGWRFDLLEDYQVYHTRYLALDCEAKHSTTFFDQCCHPLLASQKLEDRAFECSPSSAASASASAAEPTSTISTPADDADDDCDEEPTSTPDDDDEDCEDGDGQEGDDNSVPPVVISTHVTHATQATQTHQTTHDTATPTPTLKPKPTSTKVAPKPTSTKAAAPAPKPPSSSSSLFTDGFATFFFQNGVAGACGTVHKDTDFVAAIDQARYGDSGKKSSLCGQQVKITNPANGKSVTVTIADDCPTCLNKDSIDLSRSAFNAIATEEEGMVKINWSFI